eukprot:scaffold7011_cov66-Amphora_coffeaeformis.AAC.1
MGCSCTERAHQCCRQRGVFRAGGGRAWTGGGCKADGGVAVVDGVDVGGLKRIVGRCWLGKNNGEGVKGDGRAVGRDTKDRLKEEEEEETERSIPNQRPIPSRQVTVGFRLSVAVDWSQQEMERYMITELKLLVARLRFVNGSLSSTTHLHWITKTRHETSIVSISQGTFMAECWMQTMAQNMPVEFHKQGEVDDKDSDSLTTVASNNHNVSNEHLLRSSHST